MSSGVSTMQNFDDDEDYLDQTEGADEGPRLGECEWCDGAGTVVDVLRTWSDGSPAIVERRNCKACGGTGKQPIDDDDDQEGDEDWICE